MIAQNYANGQGSDGTNSGSGMRTGCDRRRFLKGVGFGAASLSMPAWARGSADGAGRKRPNVILVMTDDQGYGDLGKHGNPHLQTPNLDRLYNQSVRLTNFHVSPTCSPSRASLLTGRYNTRTGVWHTVMGRSLLRADEITMGDVFSANGYRTGVFGKWHLGDNYPFRPQERGFHETLVHGGGGVGQTPDHWGNDYFDDTYLHNGTSKQFTGYCTNVFFDGAMDFIEANKDRPFFCYLPTNAAHGPFYVDDRYADPYRKAGLPDAQARFFGMIANIDENMARLTAKLEELGLAENTILIFMTDNGTAKGDFNSGMRGIKGSEYDGGHRVPFFIRWPGGGLEGGREVGRVCAHIDVLPTLVDLADLEDPDPDRLDGVSLSSLLNGEGSGWPSRTLVVDSQRIEHPEKWRKSAVMTDRWRLINGKELYDIGADPGQENDVSGSHSDVVEKLRGEYEEWWTSVSERFDEYCEIVIGDDTENPSRLNGHDWHEPTEYPPWHQTHILNAAQTNGFWAVEIAHDGDYEFSLRRWPEEINRPITAAIEGGKAIRATQARLQIAGIDRTQPIEDNAVEVTFSAKLEAGKTRLKTWFMDGDESRGAYYVSVKRLN